MKKKPLTPNQQAALDLQRYAPGGLLDNGPLNPLTDPYKHLRPKPSPKEVEESLKRINELEQEWGQK